jgi:hypothetical protein
MAFAPDGRLFVAEQGGTLQVIKRDKLLARPFLGLSVDSNGERGLSRTPRRCPTGSADGGYFFSDLCSGWIYRIETTGTRTIHRFATDLGSRVDLDVGPHGGLLYLSHSGTVGRIQYLSGQG